MSETTTPATTEAAPTEAKPKPSYIWGVGRRKSAVARVRIAIGSGKIEVNGRTINDYFTAERDRMTARRKLPSKSRNRKAVRRPPTVSGG